MAPSVERQRFILLLFGIFAGIALLLASVGIYGALAYLTSASTVAVGIVVGAAAAWGAGRLLARVVDGMRPTDLSTATVMTSVLVAAAMLASVV